jgi:hypothetical protein
MGCIAAKGGAVLSSAPAQYQAGKSQREKWRAVVIILSACGAFGVPHLPQQPMLLPSPIDLQGLQSMLQYHVPANWLHLPYVAVCVRVALLILLQRKLSTANVHAH